MGRNYAEHAAELGNEVPAEPLVFLKPNTSVVGPGDPIVLPAASRRVDYEGELAVVIGRVCRDVPRERVGEVVLGYTCANDVTARDLQKSDGQWWRAKGYDSFCPLGPYLATGIDSARPARDHAARRGRRPGRADLADGPRRAGDRRVRVVGDDAAARRRDPHRDPRGRGSDGAGQPGRGRGRGHRRAAEHRRPPVNAG